MSELKFARLKEFVFAFSAIRDVCVPRRCFQQTLRKLKNKRSVIELKKLSVEKAHCNRFILSEINGGDADNPNEQISPESTTRLMMEIRNSLQRKEYVDLSKLICMFTEMPLGTRRWYPTLIRVGFILTLVPYCAQIIFALFPFCSIALWHCSMIR